MLLGVWGTKLIINESDTQKKDKKDNMKRLLIACLLSALCGVAIADGAPDEFWKAFAKHQENGTLLHYQTPRDFEVKRLGECYRDAMADKFKGEPSGGLHLEIKTRDNYQAKVGNKVALVFHLHNRSQEKVQVTTGGSCKTVHEAGFMVIDPKGRLHQSLGLMKVGGPHCFCRQYAETLDANSTVKLDTQTDSEDVMNFAPSEPGKYIMIGTYRLPNKGQLEHHVLSAPVVVEITGK